MPIGAYSIHTWEPVLLLSGQFKKKKKKTATRAVVKHRSGQIWVRLLFLRAQRSSGWMSSHTELEGEKSLGQGGTYNPQKVTLN